MFSVVLGRAAMGTTANSSTPPGEHRPSYQPLIVVFAAVSAGIVADRAWCIWPVASWSAALAACALWLPLRWLAWHRAAAVAVLLAVAAAGGAWHHLRWYAFAADDLA